MKGLQVASRGRAFCPILAEQVQQPVAAAGPPHRPTSAAPGPAPVVGSERLRAAWTARPTARRLSWRALGHARPAIERSNPGPSSAAKCPLAATASNGGPCGPSQATGTSPAIDPAATHQGSAPIRTDGQEKSSRDAERAGPVSQMTAAGAWLRTRLPAGAELSGQSLTLTSDPCQDSPPTGARNSRFPRHAPRGWALLPGLSAIARAASGSCGRWGGSDAWSDEPCRGGGRCRGDLAGGSWTCHSGRTSALAASPWIRVVDHADPEPSGWERLVRRGVWARGFLSHDLGMYGRWLACQEVWAGGDAGRAAQRRHLDCPVDPEPPRGGGQCPERCVVLLRLGVYWGRAVRHQVGRATDPGRAVERQQLAHPAHPQSGRVPIESAVRGGMPSR